MDMNPNFNSGFLQEAFRLSDENWNKYGDPNLYANQQIRQNQALLSSIQNVGALQANQLQQLQAMKQIQDIQRAGEEERIQQILYPVNDGRGGSFMANLRQIEGLKSAQAYNQQVLANENLRNQSQLASLKTAEAVDQYSAEHQTTPKLMDFTDRVGSLTARIRSGGEDGALAFKELESMRIDPTLYQYTDAGGQTRASKEASALFENVLDKARKEARSTSVYQTKENMLKELSDAEERVEQTINFRDQLKPEQFQQAWELRTQIRKLKMNMDYNKPDPEEIGRITYEASAFNPSGLQKKREAIENTEVVKLTGKEPTEITAGPKGVEVKAETPKATSTSADTYAGRRALKTEEEANAVLQKVTDLDAQIEMLREKEKKSPGTPATITDKDQRSFTKDDLEAQKAVYEKQYAEILDSNPEIRRTPAYERIKKTSAGPSAVPNVMTNPKPVSATPTVNTTNAGSTNAPVKIKKVPTLRYVRQADGSIKAVEDK